MELVTLAVLIATIATLHRVATGANAHARALLPALEDPLTIVLARRGFVAENHRVVEIARNTTTVLPLAFRGEVDGFAIRVERQATGLEQEIEITVSVPTKAWAGTSVVVSWVLEPEGRLDAALLGAGMARHVADGATLSFDGERLRIARPNTYASARRTPDVLDALVRTVVRLLAGPDGLDAWTFDIATTDDSPVARRTAMKALLDFSEARELVQRAIDVGRRDDDVGVRLAVAEHLGENTEGLLILLAGSVEESSRIRRDALEQLVTRASLDGARAAVESVLVRDDARRHDGLAVLTELVAEGAEHAARVYEVIDCVELLRLARPVLWALIVAADEPLALRAVERLGEVGSGHDVHDLARIEASPKMVARAQAAARNIRERVGIHSLSIVEPDERGALSVARKK